MRTLLIVLTLLFASGTCGQAADLPAKPNILFILTDDKDNNLVHIVEKAS